MISPFCQKLTERFLYEQFDFNGISLLKAFSPVFPFISAYENGDENALRVAGSIIVPRSRRRSR